ncbi:MAG: hypothetical protein QM498_11130 [Desulfobacterium sp.]
MTVIFCPLNRFKSSAIAWSLINTAKRVTINPVTILFFFMPSLLYVMVKRGVMLKFER